MPTISAPSIALQRSVQRRHELSDAARALLKVTVAASKAVGKELAA